MAGANIRVMLVDDHPMTREGLSRMLAEEPRFEVCGLAADASQAMQIVTSSKPDLVVTDLSLPGRNGLELVKDIRAYDRKINIIVVSLHDELIYAERALRAGARGYVMKDAPVEQQLQAIRTVGDGKIYTSPAVTMHFLSSFSGDPSDHFSFPLTRLTDRELEIFELVGQGKSVEQISAILGITPRTVEAHKKTAREKLGLADSTALLRYAVRWLESGTRDTPA